MAKNCGTSIMDVPVPLYQFHLMYRESRSTTVSGLNWKKSLADQQLEIVSDQEYLGMCNWESFLVWNLLSFENSKLCKKNALSSGYQYHMGHLILYILKWYSTTEVILTACCTILNDFGDPPLQVSNDSKVHWSTRIGTPVHQCTHCSAHCSTS